MILRFNQYSKLSENVIFHFENKLSIFENNVFRIGSDAYYELISEVRELYDNNCVELSNSDKEIYENTEFGRFVEMDGKLIPLDFPMVNEEAEYKGRDVELNKPMRSSGPKKYKVYVKNPKTGKVKVVHFGDVKGGLKAKINDPEARKAFSARHKCDTKTNKLTPGYWSCRLNKFPYLFSGKDTSSGYW